VQVAVAVAVAVAVVVVVRGGCLPAPPLGVCDEGTVGVHRLAQGRLAPPLGLGTYGTHDLLAQLRGRRRGLRAEAMGEG
jgi:hypothetical protein